MKKLIFVLALSAGFVSCSKEDVDSGAISNVSSAYKPMVVEYTATWCSPCGGYGVPAWEDTHRNYTYQITGISMHPSDAISDGNSAAQLALKAFWGFSGTPSTAVNADPKFYPSTSAIASKINAVKMTKAKAGVGITKTLSGSTLTINTKTVCFEDIAGDVYLAVYVVENGISNSQAGHTPSTITHDHIFRGSANGNFGESLGSLTKGKIIDGSYTFAVTADTQNMQNLHVVCVLWTMAGGVPTSFINSNATYLSAQ